MSKGGRVSLSEVMGRKAGTSESLSLDDLGELLGERMPKLEFNPLGRVRILRALRDRFGAHYRNVPGVSDVLKEFDSNAQFEIKKAKMKQIKFGGRP